MTQFGSLNFLIRLILILILDENAAKLELQKQQGSSIWCDL